MITKTLHKQTIKLIDTPGTFDTGGKLQDSKIEKDITSYVSTNLNGKLDYILLFVKFTDPFTGIVTQPFEFAMNIASQFNSSIIIIHTYSNSLDFFPAKWQDKYPELDKISLWKKWKFEKLEKIKQLTIERGNNCPLTVCLFTDFGKNKHLLPDGSNSLNEIASVFYKCTSLLSECSPNKQIQVAAQDSILSGMSKSLNYYSWKG